MISTSSPKQVFRIGMPVVLLLGLSIQASAALSEESATAENACAEKSLSGSCPTENDLTGGRRFSPSPRSKEKSSTREGAKQQQETFEQLPVREQILAPEKPTEFQKFVESSVGVLLPIYGSWLFDRAPSTFAPVEHVPVSADYVLGPGDQIELRIWGQINADEHLTVDRQGNVFVPQVGRVNVAGLPFSQIQETLKSHIGHVFRNFELSVDMGDLRSIEIFVMGHARRPGTYTVSSLSTLVNALFVSGGPSPQGSMRNIQLKRDGQLLVHFDMYDLLLHGDKTKDIGLKPGDVIFIPAAGARVAIAGSIENAGIYEIGTHCSLRDILADAGGLSPVAAGQHAVLERIDNRATLVSENLQLRGAGLDTQVQDGDIINLLKVVPRFAKTVALKGNVADPVRLPWHDGMRVSDLIPEKQALLTRDYWTEHNRLTSGSGAYSHEVRSISLGTSLAGSISEDQGVTHRKFAKKNDFQPPAPDINWSYAAIERTDAQTLSTRLIPFNLGRAVLDHDEAADLPLEAGDIVNVFSMADFATPLGEQTRIVRLEGEVKMAGLYTVRPGETLQQLVERAGGLTDKAYLYAAEFTRESTRREQQKRLNDYLDQSERELNQNSSTLASRTVNAQEEAGARASIQAQYAALERFRSTPVSGRIVLNFQPNSQGPGALPQMSLENGDRFLVPSIPSTVSVMGTVYNQSTFSYAAESNIRDYLKLSGGPTKYADAAHMFVIRADGSVVSRANHSRFEALDVEPGDAVIVPTNVLKTSKIRSLLDWSQVISGFGIGAAAINVLK